MPHSAAVPDDGLPDWPGLSRCEPRANQRTALRRLTDQIRNFVHDEKALPIFAEDLGWEEALMRKRFNYQGHIVSKSVPFAWRQVVLLSVKLLGSMCWSLLKVLCGGSCEARLASSNREINGLRGLTKLEFSRHPKRTGRSSAEAVMNEGSSGN